MTWRGGLTMIRHGIASSKEVPMTPQGQATVEDHDGMAVLTIDDPPLSLFSEVSTREQANARRTHA
jgi:hypothetical protein